MWKCPDTFCCGICVYLEGRTIGINDLCIPICWRTLSAPFRFPQRVHRKRFEDTYLSVVRNMSKLSQESPDGNIIPCSDVFPKDDRWCEVWLFADRFPLPLHPARPCLSDKFSLLRNPSKQGRQAGRLHLGGKLKPTVTIIGVTLLNCFLTKAKCLILKLTSKFVVFSFIMFWEALARPTLAMGSHRKFQILLIFNFIEFGKNLSHRHTEFYRLLWAELWVKWAWSSGKRMYSQTPLNPYL